jgi:hypothetical protein
MASFEPVFETFKEPRNRFQGSDSAKLEIDPELLKRITNELRFVIVICCMWGRTSLYWSAHFQHADNMGGGG